MNGVKNAIMVDAEPVGQTLYYGSGAGAGATASAVMADVVDMVRALAETNDSTANLVPHLAFQPETLNNTRILSSDEMISGYYLRLQVKDDLGVLAEVTRILSESKISIDAILQQPAHDDTSTDLPVIIMVDPVVERNMNEAIAKIEALDTVTDKVVRIRLDELMQ